MRQSPLLPCFPETAFAQGEVDGVTLAVHRRDGRSAATWMSDHSHGQRSLWVGEGAEVLLAQDGLERLDLLQRVVHPRGGWIVRLGSTRFLRVGASFARAPSVLLPGFLELPLDSADLSLGGEHAVQLLSEFCASPISGCTSTGWYPVTLAGHEVALWRDELIFHVVCAPADALSLFATLAEGLRDLGGELIGLHDIPERSQSGVKA